MVSILAVVGLALWALGFMLMATSTPSPGIGLGLLVTGAIYQGAAMVVAAIRNMQAGERGAHPEDG